MSGLDALTPGDPPESDPEAFAAPPRRSAATPAGFGDLLAVVERAHRDWLGRSRPCVRCAEPSVPDDRGVCWTCGESDRLAAERAAARRDNDWPVLEEHAWTRFAARELGARLQTQQSGLLARAQELAEREKPPPQVVLRGPTRTGKTSVAVAMLRAWEATHGGLALFVPSLRLAGGGFKLDAVMMKPASLVVLDDLGQEKHIASSVVPDLIYERHARSLPTWVTTFMSSGELRERYGDGIARRVLERAVVLEFGA